MTKTVIDIRDRIDLAKRAGIPDDSLRFHMGPGNHKRQLDFELRRVTATLAERTEELKAIRRELSETHNALRERDEELDAIRCGNLLDRLRVVIFGQNARLARKVNA